jgi:hypothetical protein
MSGRVIFLPLVFMPTDQELMHLARLQENLHYSRLAFLQAIQRETPFQQKLAHIRYVNLLKSRLVVMTSFFDPEEE